VAAGHVTPPPPPPPPPSPSRPAVAETTGPNDYLLAALGGLKRRFLSATRHIATPTLPAKAPRLARKEPASTATQLSPTAAPFIHWLVIAINQLPHHGNRR